MIEKINIQLALEPGILFNSLCMESRFCFCFCSVLCYFGFVVCIGGRRVQILSFLCKENLMGTSYNTTC